MNTKQLTADLRRMADELEAADALQTQDAPRMMMPSNKPYGVWVGHHTQHEWNTECDCEPRCVPVEPAPSPFSLSNCLLCGKFIEHGHDCTKAQQAPAADERASTSDAPTRDCAWCGDPMIFTTCRNGCSKEQSDGTGKAPAEPVKPRRSWIVTECPKGVQPDHSPVGELWIYATEEMDISVDVLLELPTAPLDDAGLDRMLTTFYGYTAPYLRRESVWHELDRAKMRAVLREYAAMGYPEVK